MQVESPGNSAHEHSEQVSLEVALLESSTQDEADAQAILVVASHADVRAYVGDSLRQLLPLQVIAVGSIASALDSAARTTPRLLVVSDSDRAVLRHFPALPAILLSDDAPNAEAMNTRLAPLVVLRGAIGTERLVEVATTLLAWDKENVTQVVSAVSYVASLKEAT